MYSQEENDFYLYLFNTFKTPGSEFIEGGQVVALFTKANLQKVILISYINVIGNMFSVPNTLNISSRYTKLV